MGDGGRREAEPDRRVNKLERALLPISRRPIR